LEELLRKLGAVIVTQLASNADELVIDSNAAPAVSTELCNSLKGRFGKLVQQQQLSNAATGSKQVEDRRDQAHLLGCKVHTYNNLLVQAQLKEKQLQDKVPFLMIEDESGRFQPEITYFPMVPVIVNQPKTHMPATAAAAAAGETPEIKWVHTLPMLDWNQRKGHSPFVSGQQSSEQKAAEDRRAARQRDFDDAVACGEVSAADSAMFLAAQDKKSAKKLLPPKLLYCELCRRWCSNEQSHFNTAEHQRRFNSEEQRGPIREESRNQMFLTLQLTMMEVILEGMHQARAERKAQEEARRLERQQGDRDHGTVASTAAATAEPDPSDSEDDEDWEDDDFEDDSEEGVASDEARCFAAAGEHLKVLQSTPTGAALEAALERGDGAVLNAIMDNLDPKRAEGNMEKSSGDGNLDDEVRGDADPCARGRDTALEAAFRQLAHCGKSD
jgi:hypothetical protein